MCNLFFSYFLSKETGTAQQQLYRYPIRIILLQTRDTKGIYLSGERLPNVTVNSQFGHEGNIKILN